MDKESKHIRQFSAADIERYHSGQMSRQEMHLLEKAALDDPFLADALEGYAFTHAPQKDLAELKDKLFNDSGREKVVSMAKPNALWFKVAAAIVVFAIGGWIVFKVMQPSPAKDIAQKTETVKQIPSQQNVTEAKKDSVANIPVQTPAVLESNANQANNVATRQYQNQEPKEQTSVPIPTTTASTDVAITDTNYYRNNIATRDLRSNNIYSGPSQPRSNFYNGRVVDTYNNALPNATVVMDNNVAIKTDKQGNFVLPANDSTQDATVLAKGFSSNRATLNTNEPIVIVMKPLPKQAVMEEVVLDKKEKVADKKYVARNKVVADTLEPTIGWTAYDNYIAEKLSKENDAVLKETHGEVLLSFEVDSKGQPVNITVEKSLCEKCDEKAIEILKQGPKWKKKKGKKGQVTIRF